MKCSPQLLFLSFIITFNFFAQESNVSVLTLPVELKKNANAVVRDNTIEITIEDVNKMIVSKTEVVYSISSSVSVEYF